jgi:methionyl-tRNA synthetase
MEPFLPFAAHRLQRMLNLENPDWDLAGDSDLLTEDHQLGEAVMLFTKIEDELITAQVQKLQATKTANQAETSPATPSVKTAKEEVTFDEFTKMDIRVGIIRAAEAVPKSKKLLKLTVDTGLDERTVLSGIGEHYRPENIIGQQVCLLVNLAPRPIMGLTSQGMILMAEDADGKLAFLQPDKVVNPGSTVS